MLYPPELANSGFCDFVLATECALDCRDTMSLVSGSWVVLTDLHLALATYPAYLKLAGSSWNLRPRFPGAGWMGHAQIEALGLGCAPPALQLRTHRFVRLFASAARPPVPGFGIPSFSSTGRFFSNPRFSQMQIARDPSPTRPPLSTHALALDARRTADSTHFPEYVQDARYLLCTSCHPDESRPVPVAAQSPVKPRGAFRCLRLAHAA
ncbi:hypothetical protein MSAN_00782200 [Mycena sanguinolenta]|uniref:Uncharacterized protein n=1 Tax=Mycena sanguinolenta TaxID=230812 RepID=A0A8H6Z655_9AGAR|nr:hypothetical protein MSAN_00782200 [Mycena sanguinolenta]